MNDARAQRGRGFGTRAKRAAFALVTVAAVLGLLEAAGALVYLVLIPDSRRETVDVALGLRRPELNNVLRYRPHPYLNYVGNPNYLSPEGVPLHHAIGIRATDVDLAHKQPGTLRIVAMGGSTTFGLYAPDARKAWPALVELALDGTLDADVEVINAGVPNYTTFELIAFAALWLPEMDADIVVVHTGLNDAFTAGYPGEGGPDNSTFRHAWSYRPMPAALRRAMRASYLVRALGTGWLSRSGHQVGDMTPAMQFDPPPEDQFVGAAQRADGRYFRRNLITLVTLIRRAGAEPVLADMPINPRFEDTDNRTHRAVSGAVGRNNRIMAQVASDLGVRRVALYPRLRDPEMFLDAAHVGAKGMIRKAEAVVEGVLPLARETLARARAKTPGGSGQGTQDGTHGAGVESDQPQR